MISIPRYLYNVAIRFGGEVVIPNQFRSKLFRYLRAEYDEKEETLRGQHQYSNVNSNLNFPPFSVAMCVYAKDNPKWFDDALASITINQTVKPNEIVLVVDGPIPKEIQEVIYKYENLLGGVL